MSKQYRWDSPYGWLGDKLTELAAERNLTEILAIARELADALDSDQIQDRFQDDMEADGYFDPLKEEEEEIAE